MGWSTCGTTNNSKIKIGQSPKKDVTAKHPHLLGTKPESIKDNRTYILNILHLSTQIHTHKLQLKWMSKSYRA